MSADDYARRGPVWRSVPASLPESARRPVALLPLAGVLAVAGVLFARGLSDAPNFDEGVYAAQTDALVHGQRLGEDVFAAQPPAFYGLLWLAARIGGVGLDQLRLTILAFALLGLLAAFLVARALAGPAAGLAAAAVLAVAPPYPTWAVRVSADLPAMVLALLALALVLVGGRGRRRTAQLLAAGVLVGLAETVKLDAAILLLPLLVLVLRRRLPVRDLRPIVAGAVATLGVELALVGSALPDVWRGAVSYHLGARGSEGLGANLHELRAFFHPHQPFTWIVVAAVVAALLRPRLRLSAGGFWLTALAAAVFLLWQYPLRDNHMVLLAIALAVPAGATLAAVAARRPAGPAVAVAVALAVAAGYVQETRRAQRNAQPLAAPLAWAVERVRASSSPADLVVSDEPAVPFLAGRRMPGSLIDTAVLRFDSGYLRDGEVLSEIDARHVPVVVAGRAFLERPALLRGLRQRFLDVREEGGVRVYAR